MFGKRELLKLFGILRKEKVCEGCQSSVKLQVVYGREWFVIFYIPLIPLKGQYYYICPECSERFKISKEEARRELNQLKKHVKGKHE